MAKILNKIVLLKNLLFLLFVDHQSSPDKAAEKLSVAILQSIDCVFPEPKFNECGYIAIKERWVETFLSTLSEKLYEM